MPPHSPGSREGAAAFSYSIRGHRVAYAARVLHCGGMHGRFATHFLRACAGNPPSQSSGTLRALPEGAASPPLGAKSLDRGKATGAGLFLRHQIVDVGVGVNNLRVIQLSKTSQVAAHRATLGHRHGLKQFGVGVGDTVAAGGGGIAEFGFVIVCGAHRRGPFVRASLQCKRHAGNTANRFRSDNRMPLRGGGYDTSKVPKSQSMFKNR